MYIEYPPCRLLATYIDKYWEFKGNPPYGMRINILPDGCTDFIFTLGEVANAIESSLIMQPYRSYFVGPMTKYSELVTTTKSVHMLGIRFLPGGLFRFMELPLSILSNQRINTNDLNTLFEESFTERLCEKQNLTERITLIEELLIKSLCNPDRTDRQITFAINRINLSKGILPVETLMKDICFCQRHFERKFKQFTGFTPKEYSRIIKFRHAIDLLQRSTPVNLLSVATDSGYYDLPHFFKEIKNFSGTTPSTFLSQTAPEDTLLTYIEQ